MVGSSLQARARSIGRSGQLGAVRAFFLLATLGLVLAALCGAALSWDGSIYLFELLDKQRPYVSQGRLITWPLHLPVVLAMTLKPTRTRQQHQTIRIPLPAKVVVGLGVVAILVLGVWPRLVLDFATQEAVQLRHLVTPILTR